MQNRLRKFRHIILPVMILIPLVMLATGCFFFPTFEYRLDQGPNIRALVGDQNSNRSIRLGHVTKAQVIALLGDAPYASEDGAAVGYVTRTGTGAWVWPLCFGAATANEKTYAVRLVFDRDGELIGYDWADAGRFLEPLTFYDPARQIDQDAIAKLNERGKFLRPRLVSGTVQIPTQPKERR